MLLDAHRQRAHAVRMDWGLPGAVAVAAGCDVAVVVDVLSFSTALTVATDRGTVVYPFRWRDESAESFAAAHDAVLAVGRSAAGEDRVSLSPATIRRAPDLPRLVLPSPNGATISAHLADASAEVIGVSLRNRRAAASWLRTRRQRDPTLSVAVIPAGERWPAGDLRPAVEDLWGAGALISDLLADGWDASPEACAAAAAFDSLTDLRAALRRCASGRELLDLGHPDDVDTAAELDRSRSVPVLRNGAYLAV